MLLSTASIDARNINWYYLDKGYTKYSLHVKEAAIKFQLDEEFICAWISWENPSWSPTRPGMGGRGMLQVKQGPLTAKEGIMSGCAILAGYIRKNVAAKPNHDYIDHLLHALTMYNAGEAGAKRYGGINLYAYNVLRFWNLIEMKRIINEFEVKYECFRNQNENR